MHCLGKEKFFILTSYPKDVLGNPLTFPLVPLSTFVWEVTNPQYLMIPDNLVNFFKKTKEDGIIMTKRGIKLQIQDPKVV